MYDFTILNENKIFYDNQLEFFKIRGTKAEVTDFAILTGADIRDEDDKIREGSYWVKEFPPYVYYKENIGRYFFSVPVSGRSNYGESYYRETVTDRTIGIRPSLHYDIKDIPYTKKKTARDGITEIYWGNYPQTAPNKEKQIQLLKAMNEGNLIRTGKAYIIDSRKYDEYDREFKKQVLEEYKFKGKKYVYVTMNSCQDSVELSNNERYHNGDKVFIEIKPVKWLVDERRNIILSEKILIGGIQFDTRANMEELVSQHGPLLSPNAWGYQDELKRILKYTTIQKYLDRYFCKDLLGESNVYLLTDEDLEVSYSILDEMKKFNFPKVIELLNSKESLKIIKDSLLLYDQNLKHIGNTQLGVSEQQKLVQKKLTKTMKLIDNLEKKNPF